MTKTSHQDEYNVEYLHNKEQDSNNYKNISAKTTNCVIRQNPKSSRTNSDINSNPSYHIEQNDSIRDQKIDCKNSINDSESIESSNSEKNANLDEVQDDSSNRERHNNDMDGNRSIVSSEKSVGETLPENDEIKKPGSRRAKLQDNDKNREILEEEFKEIEMMYCEHCDKSFAPPTFKRICQTYDNDGVLKCVKMYKKKRKVFSSAKVRKRKLLLCIKFF